MRSQTSTPTSPTRCSATRSVLAVLAIEKQRLKVTDSIVDAAQENITYGDAEVVRMMMRNPRALALERAAEARFGFRCGRCRRRAPPVLASHGSAAQEPPPPGEPRRGEQARAGASRTGTAGRRRGVKSCLVLLLGGGVIEALPVLQGFALQAHAARAEPPTRRAATRPRRRPCRATLGTAFTTARESLRVAKEDAFDSIHSLVRARALAYDANGDESRGLPRAGRQRAATSARSRTRSSSSRTARPTPPGAGPRNRHPEAHAHGPAGDWRGTEFFRDELDNITFPVRGRRPHGAGIPRLHAHRRQGPEARRRREDARRSRALHRR